MTHPLLDVLLAAAGGRPPAADGSVHLLPPLTGPVDAVVTFTAHSFVVADVDERLLRSRLRPDDPGATTHAAFIAWLAEHLGGRAGQLDVVLAAPALDGPPQLDLERRDDLGQHHRVARAA
ncbi:MAG TPA: GNAT family N-acetyltransferase, partial [Candidatus Dormibacteraeota bacterium]|nr:GNAT family N-acetyltransferase [Candidatus Dormibacteraeota bacterium]